MTVVINEFEVVAQPAPVPPREGTPPAPGPPPLSPREIEQIVLRQRERAERVRAH